MKVAINSDTPIRVITGIDVGRGAVAFGGERQGSKIRCDAIQCGGCLRENIL